MWQKKSVVQCPWLFLKPFLTAVCPINQSCHLDWYWFWYLLVKQFVSGMWHDQHSRDCTDYSPWLSPILDFEQGLWQLYYQWSAACNTCQNLSADNTHGIDTKSQSRHFDSCRSNKNVTFHRLFHWSLELKLQNQRTRRLLNSKLYIVWAGTLGLLRLYVAMDFEKLTQRSNDTIVADGRLDEPQPSTVSMRL